MSTARTMARTMFFGLLVTALCLNGNAEDPDTKPKHNGLQLAEAQVEWLRSKGGYFDSDKISIKPLFEDGDASAPLGLFATKDFVKGETLMFIPRSTLVTAGPDSKDMCDTARNLVREFQLKEKSQFEPYVSYVFSKETISLPSNWSSKGKELLLKIRGPYLPPRDLVEVSFENDCAEEDDDDSLAYLHEFAYLTVVVRAWTDILVPVYDMVNHQTGRFANVDSTKVQSTKDIVVHATRDITAGEQLFLSYMDCIDERGYENEWVLPQMLRDFGFVDHFPQRWTFPARPTNLVFDLDFLNEEANALFKSGAIESPEMEVTWRTNEPTKRDVEFLQNELKRLESIDTYVNVTANALKSDNEREVSLDYYRSLRLAIRSALGQTTVGNGESCLSSGSNGKDFSVVCAANLEEQKVLSNNQEKYESEITSTTTVETPVSVTIPATVNKQQSSDHWMACNDYEKIKKTYEHVEDFYSHYQDVDIYYGKENDDACLYLDGWLHTCVSFRSHYHEPVVHYPARFLDEIKRVLFIGGGDNLVVHEVLKYPTLELVVGLELDQSVVRASYRNFGSQPHWDNEKVRWYFGDAAKSLLVLPSDYYGSFDLVIVDIQTTVAESLKVNNELNLIEAATLLMKPDGIIVKNEDEGYVPGSKSDGTNYAVDLIYHDVPFYCIQALVVGSNTIDFLSAQPKDHGVETLYLEGLSTFQSQFDSWYNFGGNGSNIIKKKCQESIDVGNERALSVGVFLVLEAENVKIALEKVDDMEAAVALAVKESGLVEIDSRTSTLSGNELAGFNYVVVLSEGYIASRCFSEHKYCALDVSIYGSGIEKLETVMEKIKYALQPQHSSSYSFVTAGGPIRNEQDNSRIGPPSAKEFCQSKVEQPSNSTYQSNVRKEKNEFGPQHAFSLHDYNNSDALKQWNSQQQLGSQILVEFKIDSLWVGEVVDIEIEGVWQEGTIRSVDEDSLYEITIESSGVMVEEVPESRIKKREIPVDYFVVSTYFEKTSRFLIKTIEQTKLDEDMIQEKASSLSAGGLVYSASWIGGDYIATWDGGSKIIVNLFVVSNDVDLYGAFMDMIEWQPLQLTVAILEEFPRGTGSIVNYEADIANKQPFWA